MSMIAAALPALGVEWAPLPDEDQTVFQQMSEAVRQQRGSPALVALLAETSNVFMADGQGNEEGSPNTYVGDLFEDW